MNGGDTLFLVGLGQARQGADAALDEHAVAMAVRIGDTALVGEHGREMVLNVIGVGRLLDQPPGVFTAAAAVVIAVADPVHSGGVNAVAPHVFQRTIGATVPGNLRMSMEFAAEILQLLASSFTAILANLANSLV